MLLLRGNRSVQETLFHNEKLLIYTLFISELKPLCQSGLASSLKCSLSVFFMRLVKRNHFWYVCKFLAAEHHYYLPSSSHNRSKRYGVLFIYDSVIDPGQQKAPTKLSKSNFIFCVLSSSRTWLFLKTWHYILERHDCEEHGRCSEELYTADGWQEAHRVLGAHQASCRL